MLLVPSNVDDIVRYYKNSYVKFKGFGDDLFYINAVSSQRITGLHQSGEEFILDMHEDVPYQLEYVLPHRAVFQFGESAVLLQRRPERQYHRGLTGNNTQVVYTHSGQALGLGFDILKAYVNKPQYYDLASCISTTGRPRWKSRALSPRMSYDRLKQRVLVDLTPVAVLDTGTKCIRLTRPAFHKEVLAVANASNVGVL